MARLDDVRYMEAQREEYVDQYLRLTAAFREALGYRRERDNGGARAP